MWPDLCCGAFRSVQTLQWEVNHTSYGASACGSLWRSRLDRWAWCGGGSLPDSGGGEIQKSRHAQLLGTRKCHYWAVIWLKHCQIFWAFLLSCDGLFSHLPFYLIRCLAATTRSWVFLQLWNIGRGLVFMCCYFQPNRSHTNSSRWPPESQQNADLLTCVLWSLGPLAKEEDKCFLGLTDAVGGEYKSSNTYVNLLLSFCLFWILMLGRQNNKLSNFFSL